MKKLLFISLFLIWTISKNNLFGQQTERIYVCEPENHAYIAQGNNLFALLLKGIETNEIKVYLAKKDVLNRSKPLSKEEYYKEIKTSLDQNNIIIPANYADFQVFYVHSQNKKPIHLDIEYFSMTISKPIQLRFDFDEIVLYLDKKFQKSLQYKGIQNIEAGYIDLTTNTIEISLGKALEQKKYKILPDETTYNFSTNEQLSLKKINKIPESIWLNIGQNKYTTIINYTIDIRKPENIIGSINSDSLFYKLYQLDTLNYQNLNVNYGELAKLIIEGVQNGQIQAQKMSADTYQNIEANRELMSKDEFMSFVGTLSPENLMLRLQITCLTDKNNRQINKSKQDITHISLIIPKGSNISTQLGSFAFAEFPFIMVENYINQLHKNSKGEKGTWINKEKTTEKMTFMQALRQGKYIGTLTKFINWNDDDLKSIFFALPENEILTEKEKTEKFISYIKENKKNFLTK
ncbi:MAG: hypothetical protein EAZ85_14205 [Bacteroidetes bacterium]|nr:MAG: hypothetical protein EAZ85_14205 [Bacteroidota bacterium]TAG89002.1 MAG: hypothetical protein EAZ20_07395 [Bacteroidota bacterium]